MTTPKKPLTKTESAIQLGNILKFGARGGGGKIKLRKIGEVQTRPKKSLQNQKPDKSPKSSDWDAAIYKQPRGHGKPMGPRAARDLEKKHPEAAMNKRIKAGTISNQPRHIKNEQFIGPLPKAHRTARLKKVAAKKKGKK